MRSKNILRRKFLVSVENLASPVIFGLAAFITFPSIAARADMAGLLAGREGGAAWRMVLTDSPAGSIHASSLAFGDESLSSSLSGAGITLPDGRKIAFTGHKGGEGHTPDSDRVNRAAKKGRVVAVEPMQPPKAFTAGSVLQRSSALDLKPLERKDRTAFVKPKRGKDIELASFYFRREQKKPDPGVSPMIAELVTNRNADILATAYAPPEPDFARESPFDAILKKKPESGRFVPAIGPKDHSWAATPLPPSVFSAEEQQCLASGIYFEARGESAKGQAAVAQVILNRVRNPAYPATICGVVYQNEHWRNRCQFSFACDNIRDRINSKYHWKMAREIALATTAGKIWLTEVGSATHYHAVYVRPAWGRSMEKVGRIGLHIFYRTYGGGWS